MRGTLSIVLWVEVMVQEDFPQEKVPKKEQTLGRQGWEYGCEEEQGRREHDGCWELQVWLGIGVMGSD